MALQWMRDRFKHLRWVLWVVIAAFVVFFGADFTGLGSVDPNRTAAWIGDEEIPTEDVRSRYRQLEDQYRQIFGNRFTAEMAQQMNLSTQALQGVVQQRVMLREAKDLGLVATDREVQETIVEFPLFQDEAGNFVGAEEYERRLTSRVRMTPDEFEERVREDLLMQKLETILAETVFISDQELESRYREQAEKAKVRYLMLPSTSFTDIEVSQAEMQTYLDEHLEEYQLPEQRSVDYLLVDAISMRQELEVPEAELRAYYDDQIDQFTSQEQVLARHILLEITDDRDEAAATAAIADLRSQIEGGGEFAALARDHSEEPDSAARGGSLGWFGRESWGADFTEIVFDAEKGAMIGPVTTQYGVHLIEVQDKRPGGSRPFEQVMPQIRNRLVTERANELAEAKAKDIASRIADTMSEADFLALAEAEGVEHKTTEPFGPRDVVPGIGRGPFVDAAFALKRDEISEPVKIPRGWAISRLSEILAPRAPTLEDVENRVRPAALAAKQREAAQARLEEAYARVASGDLTFDALATELEVEVQESVEFGAGDNVPGIGRVPELVKEALAGEAGTTGGPFTVPQGAVVYEVAERIRFDPETYAEEKESFLAGERAQRLNQMRAAILARRIRDLEVKYNEGVLELLGAQQPTT